MNNSKIWEVEKSGIEDVGVGSGEVVGDGSAVGVIESGNAGIATDCVNG